MTAADLTISVSSQERYTDEREREKSSEEYAREDKGMESSYDIPVTTGPFYTLLPRESSFSYELTARNLFALAIKNTLGRPKTLIVFLPRARSHGRFISDDLI